MLPLLLLSCRPDTFAVGAFDVTVDRDNGALLIARDGEVVADLKELAVGSGSAEIEHQMGAYRFSGETLDLDTIERYRVGAAMDGLVLTLRGLDRGGDDVARVELYGDFYGQRLDLLVFPERESDRARASFACTGSDHFLGGGGHAFDVDHAGEAFGLWVSEPGVGKTDSEYPTDDWFITGTRHASSYPTSLFLRPDEPLGVAIDTWSRVDVDLCSSDPSTWSMTAWDDHLSLVLWSADTPLDVVSEMTLAGGSPEIPPDWAFAAWNDAIRGYDRLHQVATRLRESGATSSVIWTEDWRGGEEISFGGSTPQYHPSREWDLDDDLYDSVTIDDELEAGGFKWLAYFAPFLVEGTETWDEAEQYAIKDENGDTFTFTGFTFETTSVLDVSDDDARDWAEGKMVTAIDQGFDGWMLDFGEWLPPEAVLAEMDAVDQHNLYPRLWQEISDEALSGDDAVAFARSGWTGSQSVMPVTWAGDQRTSFAADDGLPTVVPIGLGLGIGGVSFYGSDIAGYQTYGNDPSDKELWFRWCELGAFSPIMRTHHGAEDLQNWQFDSDEETLAHYARYSNEHARLFPYLRGLAELAHDEGRPLIMPVAMLFEDADWARIDAWMLGPALLVAPVMEADVTGRQVDLPSDVRWFDWFTGDEVQSGWLDADLDQIPVLAAEGTVVPTLSWAPDTFADATDSGVTTLDDAEKERTIYVFGEGGSFVEADGTTYTVSGTATRGEASDTLDSGTIAVGDLVVTISGDEERSYTVVVRP